MKKWIVLCLMMVTAGSIAPGAYAFDGFFAALGAEANANTREGAAAGGSLSFGADLNRHFALGAKAVFSHDFNAIGNLEPAAFLRWFPLPSNGLFLQGEIGGSFFFEDGDSYPSILGGIGAGWRLVLGERFYLEPSVRGGYPFVWAGGIMFGVLIPGNSQGGDTNEK